METSSLCLEDTWVTILNKFSIVKRFNTDNHTLCLKNLCCGETENVALGFLSCSI